MENIYGKVKKLYGTCEGFFKKNEKLYGKMLNLVEKVKEFIWQKIGKVKNLYGTCEGCLKKNEKLYGKMLNLTEQVKEFYMEKWRIRLDKRKNLYGPTVF